jgi:hypothetical protein
MSNKFIDISEHNTILSINAIGDCNLKGCIIKVTEGTDYIDHACDILYDGINGQLPIGFYHYLTSLSEPETQALNFWTKIKNKEYQILPVLDVEAESLGNKAQQYADRFMTEFFKLSGQAMMIYSGRCYIQEHFDVSFRNDNLWWVADYDRNNPPTILGCRIVGWQYTDSSHEYAFNNGDLDVSILIDESNFYIENFVPFSEPPDLQPSTDILTLQKELNNQGFTDKNFNPLELDGIAGELTLSACPILSIGMSGNITKWVQSRIGMKEVDGLFGEKTRQAVIEYQENNSLDGDGVIGQNTWRKLLGM